MYIFWLISIFFILVRGYNPLHPLLDTPLGPSVSLLKHLSQVQHQISYELHKLKTFFLIINFFRHWLLSYKLINKK